jgi:hypothetical protein
VERRRERRTTVSKTVAVVVTGRESAPLRGRMEDLSGRGMRLVLSEPVDIGAALRVECDDRWYLGEVIYCQSEQSSWMAGVEVDQCLQITPGIERLRRSLQEYPPGPTTSSADEATAAVRGERRRRLL